MITVAGSLIKTHRSVHFSINTEICSFSSICFSFFFFHITRLNAFTRKPQARLAVANNLPFGWNTLVLAKLCRLSWQRVTLWHFQSVVFITSHPPCYVHLWHFGRGGAGTGNRRIAAAGAGGLSKCLYVPANEPRLLYSCTHIFMQVCRLVLSCVCSPQESVSHLSCCISSLYVFMLSVGLNKIKTSGDIV